MVCEEIFKRINYIKLQPGNKATFEVSVSMLEIYNEHVQDLLDRSSKVARQALQIREHVKMGVYVEGLQQFMVSSYEDIKSELDRGTKNRTIRATMMNATSSRAHTILTIKFIQNLNVYF